MHISTSWCRPLTVLCLLAAACGGERAPVTDPIDTGLGAEPVPVEMSLNGGRVELAAGDSSKVYTNVRYAGHDFVSAVVALQVRDTTVARLDAAGFVHAGPRAASTWLIGTTSTLRDSVVVNIYVSAFYLSQDTSVVPLGTTRTLTGRSFSAFAGGAVVAATGWASSNTAIATVDAQGLVTPVSLGLTTISATVGSVRATTEVIVTAFDHLHSFVSVKTGWDIACGIEADGTAYCWGAHFSFTAQPALDRCESLQYYTVRTTSSWSRQMQRCALTPVKLATTLRFQQASRTASGDVLLLSMQGGLYVVGNESLAPVSSDGAYKWATTQSSHSCGIIADDTGWCWGNNFAGVLGNGTAISLGTDPAPHQLVGNLKWKELHTSHYNACGLTTAGQAFCWGHNYRSILGVGPGTGLVGDCAAQCVVVPTAVRTDVRFATLALRDDDRCGIDLNGDTWCWGAPPAGVDPLAPEAGPARIASAPRFVTLRGPNICGVTADGAAYCLLGNSSGTTMAARYSFVRVPLPFAASQLEVSGLSPACARSADDGAVYCWGDGGRLGDGTLNAATPDKPARVAGQVP